MLWKYISVSDYLTGTQTTLTVIIIPGLTRPGNCSTCSVGHVIRAALSQTLADAPMKWLKLGCVVPLVPLGQ